MGRPKGSTSIPKYRLHKSTGYAIVTLSGTDRYLGKYDSPASRRLYDQLIAEWMLKGRCIATDGDSLTIEELIAAYWTFAQEYFKGSESSLCEIRRALFHVRQLYADTQASAFDQVKFEAVRQHMLQVRNTKHRHRIGLPLSRKTINSRMFRILDMIRWAAQKKMIPSSVWQDVQTVKRLEKNRSEASESIRVRPPLLEDVEATMPFLPSPFQAVVRIQMFTGMRCGEVLGMRNCDLDMSPCSERERKRCPKCKAASSPCPLHNVWHYRPQKHKTQDWIGERTIVLGPKAQEAIRPFMTLNAEGYIFSPRRHMAETQPFNKKSKFNDYYTGPTFARAIDIAIKRADSIAHKENPNIPAEQRIVSHWHSHQLRHLNATVIRKNYDLDTARAILGHTSSTMTEIYAELDIEKAAIALAKIG